MFLAMPEEDNSILGESVYQHLRYEQRESAHAQQHQSDRVDLKMFEHQQNSITEPQLHNISMSHEMTDEEEANVSQSEYGDWSREDIYQSISR